MLDQDQNAFYPLNKLINEVTNGYLMRTNCFALSSNASGYTNFFLQQCNAPAIVLVREEGYETIRGIVFPITSENYETSHHLSDSSNAMGYLKQGDAIAKLKDMLLMPRPYLEALGIIDDLHFVIDSKLHFGQKIITKPNVADYAHHIFYEETGTDLKQARFPHHAPKGPFGNAAGAKFEEKVSAGNYQIDVVPMPN